MKSSYKPTKVINSLIDEGRIIEAIDHISKNDLRGACRAMLSQYASTYKYMLGYFEKSVPGTTDASREDIAADIMEGLRCCADLLEVSELEQTESGLYFSIRRIRGIHPDENIISGLERLEKELNVSDLMIDSESYSVDKRRQTEKAGNNLFQNIWTTLHISKQEKEALHAFLVKPATELSYPYQSLALSALLLGSLQYFDSGKLKLLLEAALTCEDNRLVAKALAGALLVITRYEKRVKTNKELKALCSAVEDNEVLASATGKFVSSMLRTVDTDRVNKKVNEDIIPELMRMKPDIEKTMRHLGEKSNSFEPEENPEWEDLLNKTGITEKLKELTEMQMDGADIFMSAFSQMKGFSFFRTVSNWFVPFDKNRTELTSAVDTIPETMIKLLTEGRYFCSSDKYSMILAMAKMPVSQFQMMSGQLSEQMESMREEMNTTLLGGKGDIASEMSMYLKDLYRFFRLKNEDAEDPFKTIFDLPHTAPFEPLHRDTQVLRSMAEFYFRYGYYKQAYKLFTELCDIKEDVEEDILQKQGYCLQLLGDNEEALKAYRNAELLNPDSDWLLKRIAMLLRDMKRYDEAAVYARKVLERKPDNLNLEMLLGTSLMLGNHPEEALKSFYKIKYLNPENVKVLRPIAWCEFLMHNYDKSAGMYNSLTDLKAVDMLNCGHALLCKGDIGGASKSYRSCINLLSGNKSEFRAMMDEDRHFLMAAGLDPLTLSLICDLAISEDKDFAV